MIKNEKSKFIASSLIKIVLIVENCDKNATKSCIKKGLLVRANQGHLNLIISHHRMNKDERFEDN